MLKPQENYTVEKLMGTKFTLKYLILKISKLRVWIE